MRRPPLLLISGGGGATLCVTHPLNPPDLRSSSLRLGKEYEYSLHSLRSVSPCEGDFVFLLQISAEYEVYVGFRVRIQDHLQKSVGR